jgi:hypothetical protein
MIVAEVETQVPWRTCSLADAQRLELTQADLNYVVRKSLPVMTADDLSALQTLRRPHPRRLVLWRLF